MASAILARAFEGRWCLVLQVCERTLLFINVYLYLSSMILQFPLIIFWGRWLTWIPHRPSHFGVVYGEPIMVG
jgi:hypothetical protein